VSGGEYGLIDTQTAMEEGHMSDSGRWGAGVIPYAEMGYWQPDYEPKDSDILAAFRITPQEGVPPEEAEARVASLSAFPAARTSACR
jgi:hypothetical protein